MGLFSFLFRRSRRKSKRKTRGDSPTQPVTEETLVVVKKEPTPTSPRSSGPVDLDEVVVNNSSSEDETNNNNNNNNNNSTTEEEEEERPIFRLAEDLRFSAGHNLQHEEEEDDGSTFNLSTDAEDAEYESMRRRLGVTLDTASVATEEDRSVFPNLPSEDECTTNSATKEAISNSLLAVSKPKQREFTTPLPPKEFTTTTKLKQQQPQSAATNHVMDQPQQQQQQQQHSSPEPFVSPKAFGEFTSDPAFDGFEQFPFSSPSSSHHSSSTKPKKLALSTKDAPDSRRRKAYSNHFDTNTSSPGKKQDPAAAQFDPFESSGGWATFGADSNAAAKKVTSPKGASKPVVSVANETKLEELLAQAKSKSSRNHHSINSAPALSASYLRQHHGLHRKQETTSVTDIITSLEAANASRPSSSRSLSGQHRHVRSPSTGSSTRRRRSHSRSRHHPSDSEDDEDDPQQQQQNANIQDQENWLMDEVTGVLGPRGIAADLESLSGRSNRSGRSGKSGRSHRRHRSGNDSVDSRRSRYSTKSYISQMSEQSRSVAADLLRLERQLAMVGANERPHRPSTRRSRIQVTAPPGKLGIILANKADAKGTVVSGVRTSSALADQIAPGDRIVAIDGEDVSLMTVSEITSIMARKNEYERLLTVLTTPRDVQRH